jgi:hypothetical protein
MMVSDAQVTRSFPRKRESSNYWVPAFAGTNG